MSAVRTPSRRDGIDRDVHSHTEPDHGRRLTTETKSAFKTTEMMVSRGLAKSGSRDPYTDDRS